MSARIQQNEIDAVLARADIVALIATRLELKKVGSEYRARCPFHDDNTPSFYVIPAKGFWNCFGCGAHGDAIGFLIQHDSMSFLDAFGVLSADCKVETHAATHIQRSETPSEKLDWSERAESIWRRTQPITGTLGEVYLRHRGCAIPPRDSHLRFLPATDRHPPSLCAAITDVRSTKPISLHFTRLAADGHGKAGSELDKLLLGGHRKRGGCIRLWPDESVSRGLAIAEGIESALAAAHMFTPIWAAIDAGNLATFPALTGLESLTIFADRDDAGMKAAKECADRWREAGYVVRTLAPKILGKDCADLVAA
jgi:phage/plasmid primase-like uncharacterized protein